jgi:hypothetical protein
VCGARLLPCLRSLKSSRGAAISAAMSFPWSTEAAADRAAVQHAGTVGEIDPRSCRQDRRHGNAKSASWKRMTIWNASRAGRQNDRRLLQARTLPRAPDQVEFRLKLRQPLELHVLIASQVVDDVAALVETRD